MYDLIINVFLIIILFYFCYSYLGYNLYEYSEESIATGDETEEQNGVNMFADIIKNSTESVTLKIDEQPEEDLSEEEQPEEGKSEEDQFEEGKSEEDKSEENQLENQSEENQLEDQSEENQLEDQSEENQLEEQQGQSEEQQGQSEDKSYDELEEDNTIKIIINDLINDFYKVATGGKLTQKKYKDYIKKQLVYIPNGNLSDDFINNSFNKCDIDKNKEISNAELNKCYQSDTLLSLITY
jgi:hypothetical protein